MSISVVVPTYRRPDHLRKAVDSLAAGTVRPDEILLVGRERDGETAATISAIQRERRGALGVRDVWVTTAGHMPPVKAGVSAASGELVAVIDDDVTVTGDWLETIVQNFALDDKVGVVGGQVVVPGRPAPRLKGKPGQVTWYGRHWGNIGSVSGSRPFEVAGVMECNWVWRRELITSLEFDEVLNFDDAAMYGLDLCLQARRRGYKVLYDPRSVVYHHIAPRTAELSRRDRPNRIHAYCANYTYVMLKHLPGWRRAAFVMWWFLVGERASWGLGAVLADTVLNGLRWRREFGPAFHGKLKGIRRWRARRSPLAG